MTCSDATSCTRLIAAHHLYVHPFPPGLKLTTVDPIFRIHPGASAMTVCDAGWILHLFERRIESSRVHYGRKYFLDWPHNHARYGTYDERSGPMHHSAKRGGHSFQSFRYRCHEARSLIGCPPRPQSRVLTKFANVPPAE